MTDIDRYSKSYFDLKENNYDKIKEKHESQSKERNICDFIAGMTDKYALTIYNDLIKWIYLKFINKNLLNYYKKKM